MEQHTDDIRVELYEQLGWFSESRKNNATGEQTFVMDFPNERGLLRLSFRDAGWGDAKLTLEQYRLLRQLDAQRKLILSNVEIAEMFGVEPYVVTRAIKCGIKRYDVLLKTRGR
jgi:hypothetical protein